MKRRVAAYKYSHVRFRRHRRFLSLPPPIKHHFRIATRLCGYPNEAVSSECHFSPHGFTGHSYFALVFTWCIGVASFSLTLFASRPLLSLRAPDPTTSNDTRYSYETLKRLPRPPEGVQIIYKSVYFVEYYQAPGDLNEVCAGVGMIFTTRSAELDAPANDPSGPRPRGRSTINPPLQHFLVGPDHLQSGR